MVEMDSNANFVLFDLKLLNWYFVNCVTFHNFIILWRKLVWRLEEENEIKKAFNSKASYRLSEMFRDAQNENKRPYWIGDYVWNDLLS